MVDGDREFYLELTDAFFGEYSALLDSIKDSIAVSDATRLNHAAHTAKGALANLCAIEAREIAFKLELAGSKGQLGETAQLVTDFEQAVASYRAVVDEIRSTTRWQRELSA
jgi:HPt (histidine-containing phosphotransfer) domain-containing protein